MARKHGDVTPEQLAVLLKRRKCQMCGIFLTSDCWQPTSREIDHIVPLNVGGTDTIENLRAVCRACNNSRPKDGSDYQGPVALWAVDVEVAAAVLATARARPDRKAERKERAEARRSERVARATEALSLRQAGLMWQEIADRLGYANTSGPYLAVKLTLGIDPRTVGVDGRKGASKAPF